MQAREKLLQLSLLYNGEWNEIYQALVKKNFPEDEEINYSGNYITILDKEYPKSLKQSFKPPFVLFYEGNLNLLKDENKKVAVSSLSGKEGDNQALVKKLLTGTNYDLILGGNTLTDEIIAQETNNSLVIVSGTPISMVSPKLRQGNYLIISEYPETATPTQENLLFSNRIIAGLCDKLLVLNCKNRSSNLQLIMQVLNIGKEILVIPVSPMEKETYNNKLIFEGATPVWTKEGLCEIMS